VFAAGPGAGLAAAVGQRFPGRKRHPFEAVGCKESVDVFEWCVNPPGILAVVEFVGRIPQPKPPG